MCDFLILGLPRSRTAWLSNFMTTGNIFCHHEAINGCHNMTDFLVKTEGCGDSDTGLALFKYEDYLPNIRTVIIDSSIDAAVNFGLEQGHNIHKAMVIEKERLDNIHGLHVDINDIDANLESIWKHLTDEPFNEKRANLLTNFNVQIKDLDVMDIPSIRQFMAVTNGYLTH